MKKEKREKEKIPKMKRNEDFEDRDLFLLRILGIEDEDWEKINVPKKQQIYMGLLEIMEKRNDMSGFARERAVKLFDIDSWIKRHKEVFEIFK